MQKVYEINYVAGSVVNSCNNGTGSTSLSGYCNGKVSCMIPLEIKFIWCTLQMVIVVEFFILKEIHLSVNDRASCFETTALGDRFPGVPVIKATAFLSHMDGQTTVRQYVIAKTCLLTSQILSVI